MKLSKKPIEIPLYSVLIGKIKEKAGGGVDFRDSAEKAA
jgi:hypothetical protein